MGVWEFFASVVDSLAWPVLVGVAVVVLRKELGEFLGAISARISDLRSARWKDLALNFSEEAEDLADDVNDLRSSSGAPGYGSTGDAASTVGGQTVYESVEIAEFDRLVRVAKVSVSAAIIEAFIQVESAVIDAALATGWEAPSRGNRLWSALDYIIKTLDLDPGTTRAAFRRLRDLRNQAAHATPDFAPNEESVLAYIDSAVGLARTIRYLANAQGGSS